MTAERPDLPEDPDSDSDSASDTYSDLVVSRGESHVARNAAIIAGVVLIAFVGLLATRKSADTKAISSQLLGRAVPAVEGPTLQGPEFNIDDYRGKWVVVNFFATWCVPCQVEHPELVKFTQEHDRAGDVSVVSVAFQDNEAALREYFAKQGGSWPVITGDTGRMALDFGVTGVPESYVVNPDGVVVAKFEGVTAADLDRAIEATGGGPAAS